MTLTDFISATSSYVRPGTLAIELGERAGYVVRDEYDFTFWFATEEEANEYADDMEAYIADMQERG